MCGGGGGGGGGGEGAAFTFVSLPATAKAIHVISKCDFSHYLFFLL